MVSLLSVSVLVVISLDQHYGVVGMRSNFRCVEVVVLLAEMITVVDLVPLFVFIGPYADLVATVVHVVSTISDVVLLVAIVIVLIIVEVINEVHKRVLVVVQAVDDVAWLAVVEDVP